VSGFSFLTGSWNFFFIIATKAEVIWLMTTALGGEGCFATN